MGHFLLNILCWLGLFFKRTKAPKHVADVKRTGSALILPAALSAIERAKNNELKIIEKVTWPVHDSAVRRLLVVFYRLHSLCDPHVPLSHLSESVRGARFVSTNQPSSQTQTSSHSVVYKSHRGSHHTVKDTSNRIVQPPPASITTTVVFIFIATLTHSHTKRPCH